MNTDFGSLEWALDAAARPDPLASLVADGKISAEFARALRGKTRTDAGAEIKRDDLRTFRISDEPGDE